MVKWQHLIISILAVRSSEPLTSYSRGRSAVIRAQRCFFITAAENWPIKRKAAFIVFDSWDSGKLLPQFLQRISPISARYVSKFLIGLRHSEPDALVCLFVRLFAYLAFHTPALSSTRYSVCHSGRNNGERSKKFDKNFWLPLLRRNRCCL